MNALTVFYNFEYWQMLPIVTRQKSIRMQLKTIWMEIISERVGSNHNINNSKQKIDGGSLSTCIYILTSHTRFLVSVLHVP